MSFPPYPTAGQATTLNGITYVYNSTLTAWIRSIGLNTGGSTATNSVKGGNRGSLLIQSAPDTTAFIPIGTPGQILVTDYSGTTATWASISEITSGTNSNPQQSYINPTSPDTSLYLVLTNGVGGYYSLEADSGATAPTYNQTSGLQFNSQVVSLPPIPSFSVDTGALVLLGGVGIGGDVHIGGNITANNSLTLTGSANGTGLYVVPSATMYYSILFHGAGEYLYNPTAGVLNVGTKDFTIEFWIYPLRSAQETVIASYSTPGLDITLNNGFWSFDTKSGTQYAGGTYSVQSWTHIAVSRSAGQVHTFTNGDLTNTYTIADNYLSAGFIIGAFDTTPNKAFNGYLSDIRVIKNVAVYTSSFTPNTTPLSANASTALLIGDQATIADSGPNNVAVSISGTPEISNQTPYPIVANNGISWIYDGSNSWKTEGDVKIGGGLTVDGTLILVDKPTIYDQAGVAVDTSSIILDTFDINVYRSAKYTISVGNKSTNQFQTSEVWLVQDGTQAYLEQTSVFSNGGSLVEISAAISGKNLLLRAIGYNAGNIIKVQRTYITV
jgi:hypothetical protein